MKAGEINLLFRNKPQQNPKLALNAWLEKIRKYVLNLILKNSKFAVK